MPLESRHERSRDRDARVFEILAPAPALQRVRERHGRRDYPRFDLRDEIVLPSEPLHLPRTEPDQRKERCRAHDRGPEQPAFLACHQTRGPFRSACPASRAL